LVEAGHQLVGLYTFVIRDERFVAFERVCGLFSLFIHNKYEAQVEIGVREIGFDDRADFVVEFGESEVAFVEVEVPQIIARLEVSRVVGEREREAVKGLRTMPRIRLKDTEIAVGFSDAIALVDRLAVEGSGCRVPVFIEKKRLFERSQTARKLDDLPFGLGKQVELTVTFEIGLSANANAFITEFRRGLTRKR